MKKIICVTLILLVIIFGTSCNSTLHNSKSSDKVIVPESKINSDGLTIVIQNDEYIKIKQDGFLISYINQFENDYGVKVNFKIIGNELKEYGSLIDYKDTSDYIKKLGAILSVKNGSELIYNQIFSLEALAKQRAVINVRGKIDNIDKIYSHILNEEVYYIPVAMAYAPKGLNKIQIKDLEIVEPNFDWTSEYYYQIRDKWLEKSNVYFNNSEYLKIASKYLNAYELFDVQNKTSYIDSDKIKNKILELKKEIFSGKYKIPKNYTYKNYYNMLFDEYSAECKESLELFDKTYINHLDYLGGWANLLRAKDINMLIEKDLGLILPQFSNEMQYMSSYGFYINRNGKNLELAYEFINGILSDSVQLKMYTEWGHYYPSYYPINKDIEAKIIELDKNLDLDSSAVALKMHVIEEIKEGRCKLSMDKDTKVMTFYNMFLQDIVKIIFSDKEYDTNEIDAYLIELHNKYNIWLNE